MAEKYFDIGSVTHSYLVNNTTSTSAVISFRLKATGSGTGRYFSLTKLEIQASLNKVFTLDNISSGKYISISGSSASTTTNITCLSTYNSNISIPYRKDWPITYSTSVGAWYTLSTVSVSNNRVENDGKNWNFCSLNLYVHYQYSGGSTTRWFNNAFYWQLDNNKITHTFNANGGSNTPSTQTSWKNESISWPGSAGSRASNNGSYNVNFILNNPEISGDNTVVASVPIQTTIAYVFDCWRDQYGNTWSGGSDTFSLHNNYDWTARWSSSESTASVPLPSAPTINNYTFSGWYTSASGGSAVNGSEQYRSNATLYAHWVPNNFIATIYYCCASESSTKTTPWGMKYSDLITDGGIFTEQWEYPYNTSHNINVPDIIGWNTPSQIYNNTGGLVNKNIKINSTNNEYWAFYTPKINNVILNLNQQGASYNGSEDNINISYKITDGEIDPDNQNIKWIYISGIYKPVCVIGNLTYCFLGWHTRQDGDSILGHFVEQFNPRNLNDSVQGGGTNNDKYKIMSVPDWGVTTTLYAQWLPLGKYVYRRGLGWTGIINSWVYRESHDVGNNHYSAGWYGTKSNILPEDLVKTDITVWTYVEDPDNPEHYIWKEEYRV